MSTRTDTGRGTMARVIRSLNMILCLKGVEDCHCSIYKTTYGGCILCQPFYHAPQNSAGIIIPQRQLYKTLGFRLPMSTSELHLNVECRSTIRERSE